VFKIKNRIFKTSSFQDESSSFEIKTNMYMFSGFISPGKNESYSQTNSYSKE
jgi:hypothetical protein